MTNEQLSLSLGAPIVSNALMMLPVMNRIGGLEELDSRLTRIEGR